MEVLLLSGTMLKPAGLQRPRPVLNQSLVQVLLGALVAESVVLTSPNTIPPPEHPRLHLGRPWPRP